MAWAIPHNFGVRIYFVFFDLLNVSLNFVKIKENFKNYEVYKLSKENMHSKPEGDERPEQLESPIYTIYNAASRINHPVIKFPNNINQWD